MSINQNQNVRFWCQLMKVTCVILVTINTDMYIRSKDFLIPNFGSALVIFSTGEHALYQIDSGSVILVPINQNEMCVFGVN